MYDTRKSIVILSFRVVSTYIDIHTGLIGIWQPEAGLNKHSHINIRTLLGLQIKHMYTVFQKKHPLILLAIS